jgi:trimeric autotransporter adhesin
MTGRFIRLATLAIAAASYAMPQSVIQTVLGGPPNSIPALSATLNNPIGIVIDSSGNYYVSLQGIDLVIKIGANGIASPFAGNGASGFSGDGGPALQAELNNPAGLAVDSSGNVYIADSTNNRIRMVNSQGIITTVAGSALSTYTGDGGPATSAGLQFPLALCFDPSGNMYIADTSHSVIRMVNTNGIISTFAGVGSVATGGDKGPATQAGLNQPAGVLADGKGNVYIADSSNNTVRVVNNGIINEFAGQYLVGNTGDNGYAMNSLLNYPTSLSEDQAGNLYILDQNNNRVRVVSPSGLINAYAGSGVGGGAGDQGLATGASLAPRAITMDPANNLYIADGTNNRIREVYVSSHVINTIAGNGLSTITPRGILLSGSMVYFSDTTADRVRGVDLSNGATSLLAGDGVAEFQGDTAAATAASLNAPHGLAVDSSGNYYIADTGNDNIRQVNTAGIINTVAGNNTASFSGDGALATEAALNAPNDVAIDSGGNIWIADTSNQRIREAQVNGNINTVAGGGTSNANSGPATSLALSSPSGILAEASGSILISDTSHNRVMRLANGTLVTVAGGNGAGFSGDGGAATSAKLRQPLGLSEDSYGNIYIADSGNDAIRQVGADGIIATVAGLPPTASGSGTPGYNGDGSPATAFELNQPGNVTTAPNCMVLISDTSNHRVRELALSIAYTITTNPTGLQVIVDGAQVSTPATFNWLPGTQHTVSAPSTQPGSTGTQFIGGAAQSISVACGAPRQSVTVALTPQYLLTLAPGVGGTITGAQGYQASGAQVTLTASPYPGYTFAGWTGACTGTSTCVVTVSGPETVGANFTASGTGPAPAISSGGITTIPEWGATQAMLASGTWVEIQGTNLSPVTMEWSTASFIGNTAPTTLGGVTVTIGGTPAYLSYVSPTQINALVPAGVPSAVPGSLIVASTSVVVANGYGTSAAFTIATAAVLPGMDEPFGNGYLAAFQGATIVGSPGYAAVTPGQVITLYGIGFGAVTPSLPVGQIATSAAALTTPVTITIGGVNATVDYAGASVGSVGLYQFNVTVPSVAAGNQPVVVSLGGTALNQPALLTVAQ